MSRATYVFAGGGTGGHLYPGLAVADALRAAEPDAAILFLTTQRRLDRELLGRTNYEQIEQPVRPATRNPLRLPAFLLAWRRSVQAARRILEQRGVRAVLGLGGYAAGPPVVAARSLGIRTAILNPDAIPGRANRYLARRADLVVLQWNTSRQHFPSHPNTQALGCPIRAAFNSADGHEGRRIFGLDADRPALVVTGASQGARTINQVMMRVWPEFRAAHPEWQLLHLSGPSDESAVRAAYANAGPDAKVVSFTHDMASALAAADMVLCRAGASTLAELTALGKPSILLPYPYHRDRHQHANANVLVEASAAIVVEDRKAVSLSEAPVRAALERVAKPAVRRSMTAQARTLARPDAATGVAAWLRH